jgi:hypothetical protein
MAQTFPRLSIEDAFRHAQAHSHETGKRLADALDACAPQPCTRAGLICLAIAAWERDPHNKAIAQAEIAVTHSALDTAGNERMSLAGALRAIGVFRWK